MIAAIVAARLLVFPSVASAECAWVSWSQMKIDKEQFDWAPGAVFPNYAACRAAIRNTMQLDEPGYVHDWWLWLTRHGPYDPKQPRPGSKQFVGALWTEDGAMTFEGSNHWVELKCLPETLTPNGPKRETR